ncbi:MAG: RQC-minor-1 family DNA-binding protein [Bacteroidota bacterium]
MSRKILSITKKKKIPVRLRPGIYEDFPEADLHAILRGADDIVWSGGRTLLTKLLKGSEDKGVLARALDDSPVYGYFSEHTLKDIQQRIDWVMAKGYLTYEYDRNMPLLVHSAKGWEIVKRIRCDELLSHFDIQLMSEVPPYDMDYLKGRNRQLMLQFLRAVAATEDPKYLPLLRTWRADEFNVVRDGIDEAIAVLAAEED